VNATTQAAPDRFTRAMRYCGAAVLLIAGAHAQAGLSFQMEAVTRHQSAEGSVNTRPEHETATRQVVLGDRHMLVSGPGAAEMFDFAGKRRVQVDLKTGTYVDYSLFDTVGFRVMEVKNRENLSRMIAAAKIDKIAFDPVFDEHALSIHSQPERTLAEHADGGDTVLSIDGKQLMRIAAGGTPVSAADAALFSRYLRYMWGGHPLALARLQALRRIPPILVMYYREVGGSGTRTLRVAGLTPAAAPHDIGRFTPGAAGADEIDQVLDRANPSPSATLDQRRQAYQAEMNAAFAEKRPLDGMLSAVEWNLMTGEPMARFSADQLAMIQADPAVRAVTQAINPRDKAALSAATRVMQSMRMHTISKRHMLQLFEANHRAKLGERSAALALFASVLRANPALAGAYKDLGDTLFAGFDMPRAWRAWDQGRRIAPGLSLFGAVNEFEQKLLREHPEYF
jgi:hypothetical protein